MQSSAHQRSSVAVQGGDELFTPFCLHQHGMNTQPGS